MYNIHSCTMYKTVNYVFVINVLKRKAPTKIKKNEHWWIAKEPEMTGIKE